MIEPKDIIKYDYDGVDHKDYPDYCDVHIIYAETKDGHVLSDEELDLCGDSIREYFDDEIREDICSTAIDRAMDYFD